MEPLQEPPTGYDGFELPVLSLSGRDYYRVHLDTYDAFYFDREPTHRFNAPDGTFGVLYASEAVEGAFAEAFLRSRRRPLRITEDQLRRRALSRFEWAELLLADFTSVQLPALGLDARIASGDCYPLAQRWAKWVHDHPAGVDGICYLARHAPTLRSVALFDRVTPPSSTELVVSSFSPSPGSIAPEVRHLLELFAVAVLPS